MSWLDYFLPFLFALVSGITLEVGLIWPTWLYGIFAALTVANFALVWYWRRGVKILGWWNLAWLPVMAQTAVLGYIIIAINSLLQQILIILLAIFLYVYWRLVYFYLRQPSHYKPFSLENLSFYINWLSVLLLGISAYGWRVFLNLPLNWLVALVVLALMIILYQNFWIAKLSWSQAGWQWLAGVLALGELFYVISFLPFDYHILGFMWAVGYYVLALTLGQHRQEKLTALQARWYGLIAILCLTAVLLTAKVF